MLLDIDGLEVVWPYDYIYPEQYNYMCSLKATLSNQNQGSSHALLEMPTGTGKCFTIDHQVLTLDGFKYFNEITESDQIAAVVPGDHNQHSIVYQQPLLQANGKYFMERELKDNRLIQIQNANVKETEINIICTDNHDLYGELDSTAQIQKITAGEFADSEDSIKLFTHCNSGYTPSFDARNNFKQICDELDLVNDKQINAFIQFYGYWCCDGSLDYYSTTNYPYITISTVKDEIYIQDLLNTIGLKYDNDSSYCIDGYSYLEKKNNVKKFSINKMSWRKYFHNQSYTHYKCGSKMNDIIKATETRQAKIELEAVYQTNEFSGGNSNSTSKSLNSSHIPINEEAEAAIDQIMEINEYSDDGSRVEERNIEVEDSSGETKILGVRIIKSAKQIQWIMEYLTVDEIRLFLSGYRVAYGGFHSLFTSSSQVRDELFHLALLAGYSVKSRIANEAGTNQDNEIINKSTYFEVCFADNDCNALYPIINSTQHCSVISDALPNTRVYCVSVNSGLIIVRRVLFNNVSKPVIIGNCWKQGTKLMLYNGECIEVENIQEGFLLMGDDNEPRIVNKYSKTMGIAELYEIRPDTQSGQEAFTVNIDHILVLQVNSNPINTAMDDQFQVSWLQLNTKTNQIEEHNAILNDFTVASHFMKQRQNILWEVSVKDFLTSSSRVKSNVKQFRNNLIQFPTPPLVLQSILSTMLTSHNQHFEVTSELVKLIAKGLGYYLTGNSEFLTYIHEWKAHFNDVEAVLHELLNKYDITPKSSKVPRYLLYDSLEARTGLLSGILESIGQYNSDLSEYRVMTSDNQFRDQIKFLARSLGFTVYSHVSHLILIAPCSQSVTSFNFEIFPVGIGKYYGFTVSGNNHRFLMEDFTITHNTISCLALILAYQYQFGAVELNATTNSVAPAGKLIYCTRTVQEMDKVVEELKKLMSYREKYYRELHEKQLLIMNNNINPNNPINNNIRDPRILAVCLSSRRNLCIHPTVSKFDNRNKVDAQCRNLTASFVREKRRLKKENRLNNQQNNDEMDTKSDEKTDNINTTTTSSTNTNNDNRTSESDIEVCSFYEGYELEGRDSSLTGIFSLNDLKQLGKEKNWCPYFTARHLVSIANVVVYNYQYLLDPKISGLVSNEIASNSVIVFDEAHNIDSICIEALSVSIDHRTVQSANNNLNKLQSEVNKMERTDANRLQEEYKNLVAGLGVGVDMINNNINNETDILLAPPVLSNELLREAIPGSIRRAKHFLMFLRTWIEYLKHRLLGRVVTSESPAAFIKHLQDETKMHEITALKHSFERLNLLFKTLKMTDLDDFTPIVSLTHFATLLASYTEGFIILFEPFDDRTPLIPDPRLQLACLCSGTSITLNDFTAVNIEDVPLNSFVLGYWNGELDLNVKESNHNNELVSELLMNEAVHRGVGVLPISRVNSPVINKGIKACIKLTFLDGRSIICTEDHKIMLTSGEYIEANNLIPGTSKVRFCVRGTDNPCFNNYNHNWSLLTPSGFLQNNNYINSKRLFSIGQLLGGVISDRTIIYNSRLTSDSLYDAELMKQLVYDAQLTIPSVINSGSVWFISITKAMIKTLKQLIGELPGKGNRRIPDIINSRICPIQLKLGFLRGLFGSDGATFTIAGNASQIRIEELGFSQSVDENNEQNLINYFNKVQALLMEFGIRSSISTKAFKAKWPSSNNSTNSYTTDNDSRKLIQCCLNEFGIKDSEIHEIVGGYDGNGISYELTLSIDHSNADLFSRTIGFGCSIHKTIRLEAGVTALNIKNMFMNKIKQFDSIVNRIRLSYNNIMEFTRMGGWDTAINTAIHEFKPQLGELGEFESYWKSAMTSTAVQDRIQTDYSNEYLSYFPNDITLLNSINGYRVFDDLAKGKVPSAIGKTQLNLPVFDLLCVKKENINQSQQVYDLSVPLTSSFCAEGIVVHNCLDASLAIKPVFEKFHSVIITSGTLSPLTVYPRILNFRPAITASFSMSLTRNCIQPLIVTRGSDQVPISSKFDLRQDTAVIANYGRLLIELSSIVPDGIVCFFTSYSYMEEIIARWKETSVLDDLLKSKLIFIETKDIVETTLSLDAYKRACSVGRGAIFFSVARGKVAEGIDFDRHYGRAVVMFGIPFQYTLSRVLRARLEYLRETFQLSESDFLSFDALRQVAQCVGRVIRSKTDYGIMIFADQRYSRNDKRDKLPAWIRQYLDKNNISLSTDRAIAEAKLFLKKMAQPRKQIEELGITMLNQTQINAIIAKQKQKNEQDQNRITIMEDELKSGTNTTSNNNHSNSNRNNNIVNSYSNTNIGNTTTSSNPMPDSAGEVMDLTN